MQRLEVACPDAPSFIGAWRMDDPTLCEELIAFYEAHPELHEAGGMMYGVDRSRKNSLDIRIPPKDLRKPGYELFTPYLRELHEYYRDYLRQWPFLAQMLKSADIGVFNIQKYGVGGHFSAVHTERASASTMHRVLVWLTYLNDVEEGGHTHFTHYGLSVKPERGKTVMWPVEWTHAHVGNVVTAGTKYILTGWLNFPIVKGAEESAL